MPVDVNGVMKVLCILCDEKKMQATLTGTTKGTAIAAGCTAVGGVMGGPVGLAVGGTVGGLAAAYWTWGTFEPVSKVIVNMDTAKQQQLYDTVMAIINTLEWSDLAMLQAAIAGDILIKNQLLGLVMDHLQNNLDMKIKVVD